MKDYLLERFPTLLTHLTGFSRLLARHGPRRGLYDHKGGVTTSSGCEKPASGGPNQPIGVVAELARCPTSRGVPRLAEWADLAPSNGSIKSETALGLGMALFMLGMVGQPGLLAAAEVQELNLYSSRHYQTDEAFYEDFTRATGIKINRIEGKGDILLERIKAEGRNSPADVFLTVDAARLWRADEAGLFQPVQSKVLEQRIPKYLRDPDGNWFGFSTRARAIFYNKELVSPGEIATYEDLADPKWKGKVCIRSSSNIYNLSLLGSIIAANGEKKAEEWARGVVANFARPPQGGDTDQIRAVASGECALGVANRYYYVRLMTSKKEKDRAVAEKAGIIFPNQKGRGTHINISGAGVLKNAPHREAAIKFLEYLGSDSAQRYFADGNNEIPVVSAIKANTALESLGDLKRDPVNVAVFGRNQPIAQKIFDRAGWK